MAILSPTTMHLFFNRLISFINLAKMLSLGYARDQAQMVFTFK